MSNAPLQTMGSTARYSALEHGGLEIVPKSLGSPNQTVSTQDPRNGGKEVVLGAGAPLERRKSNDAAEVMHPGQYEQPQRPVEESMASYYAPEKTGYFVGDAHEVEDAQGDGKAKRRYCGIKGGIFIAVVAALVVVIVLAAVLGGVLGTVLHKHYDS